MQTVNIHQAVPDDFDTLGACEIESLFSGQP